MCDDIYVKSAFIAIAACLSLAACGDRFEGVWARNDGREPLTMARQYPGAGEYPLASPLPPGSIDEVGFVGGWPDAPHDVIIKAYDPRGTLVYCRRFTPAEYGRTTERSPVSVKPGDDRCK